MCGIKISLFSPFRHDGLGDLKRWDMGRHLLFTSWSSCSRSPPCPCPWWEGAWRGYKLKYYYMTIDNLITNSGSQLCRYLPNVVHHLVWYGDFSIWNAKQLVYRHNLTPAPAISSKKISDDMFLFYFFSRVSGCRTHTRSSLLPPKIFGLYWHLLKIQSCCIAKSENLTSFSDLVLYIPLSNWIAS